MNINHVYESDNTMIGEPIKWLLGENFNDHDFI